jgi:uncharacterized membrane protein
MAVHVLREQLTNLTVTMPLSFRMVFSMSLYIGIAAIFSTFWVIFNTFDQLLFFHLCGHFV